MDNTEGGSGKNWNQFEANQRLFNVKSSYDENLYTSKLDTSKLSKDQLEYAERMAKEIEGQTSDNIHLQEERGHLQERDSGMYDEEDLYSGVLGSRPSYPHGAGGSEKEGSGKSVVNTLTGAWKKGLKVSSGTPPVNTNATPNSASKKQQSGATAGGSRSNSANANSPSVDSADGDNVWRRRGTPSIQHQPATAASGKQQATKKAEAEDSKEPAGVAGRSGSSNSPPPGLGAADSAAGPAEPASDSQFTTPRKDTSASISAATSDAPAESQSQTAVETPAASKAKPAEAAGDSAAAADVASTPAAPSTASSAAVTPALSDGKTPPPLAPAPAAAAKAKSKFALNAGAAEFKPSFGFTPSPNPVAPVPAGTPMQTPTQTPTPTPSGGGTPGLGQQQNMGMYVDNYGQPIAPHMQTPPHGQQQHQPQFATPQGNAGPMVAGGMYPHPQQGQQQHPGPYQMVPQHVNMQMGAPAHVMMMNGMPMTMNGAPMMPPPPFIQAQAGGYGAPQEMVDPNNMQPMMGGMQVPPNAQGNVVQFVPNAEGIMVPMGMGFYPGAGGQPPYGMVPAGVDMNGQPAHMNPNMNMNMMPNAGGGFAMMPPGGQMPMQMQQMQYNQAPMQQMYPSHMGGQQQQQYQHPGGSGNRGHYGGNTGGSPGQPQYPHAMNRQNNR
jgi:hypothetical protein